LIGGSGTFLRLPGLAEALVLTEQVVAALLHEGIEDAGQSRASIAARFGEGVARIVRDCPDTAESWSAPCR
jgi:(p)ppGpp synthase/HD superfamily hydrolase